MHGLYCLQMTFTDLEKRFNLVVKDDLLCFEVSKLKIKRVLRSNIVLCLWAKSAKPENVCNQLNIYLSRLFLLIV